MQQNIKNYIEERMGKSRELQAEFYICQAENIALASQEIASRLRDERRMYIFGNGGSAADAQHIAGELVGRYKLERSGLPVVALTSNSSILTAIANDYDFNSVFERQVEALARGKDILLGITTSGSSEDVLRALKKGREIGTYNITLTGNDGGRARELSDININAPSQDTPIIQECHLIAYHIICDLVEKGLFGKS